MLLCCTCAHVKRLLLCVCVFDVIKIVCIHMSKKKVVVVAEEEVLVILYSRSEPWFSFVCIGKIYLHIRIYRDAKDMRTGRKLKKENREKETEERKGGGVVGNTSACKRGRGR